MAEYFIIVRAFCSSSERLIPMSFYPKFMRATLVATAILVPLIAGQSPVLAQDREDHAARSAVSQHEAMAAARDLLDVNGEMKRLEAQFPAMADAAQWAKESRISRDRKGQH